MTGGDRRAAAAPTRRRRGREMAAVKVEMAPPESRSKYLLALLLA